MGKKSLYLFVTKTVMFRRTGRSAPTVSWILIVVVLLAVGPLPLVSGEPREEVELTETAALPDYLAVAALNNPGLKAAFHRWKAASARVARVRSLPEPTLTFGYFIREVETRVGPQRQKVGVMQMFPWFGKLKLRGDAALEAARAAGQRFEDLKLGLFYRVKESYYEYYYLTRALAVLGENVQLLKYLEGVIRTRYRVGLALHADLIKIQLEQDRLEEEEESVRSLLGPVKSRLNAALNRPLQAPLPVPPGIPAPPPPPSHDRLVQLLEENNPQLKALDHLAAGERVGVRLARKNYFPDFSLGVDYIFTAESPLPGVPDSGKDPLAAMVSVQLPLWSKKNRAAVREAEARYHAALFQREERGNRLLSDLEMVFYRFRDAGRKIALYRDGLLPKARQALEVTRSAFESGKTDFLHFIDALRTLLEFELAHERAQAHRAQRLAELEMLVGTALSPVPAAAGIEKKTGDDKNEK